MPGLADAAECDVTVRSGDNGGRIVTWRARVDRVEPGSEEWQEVVPAMVTARLNLRRRRGGRSSAGRRTAAVLRLTPTGELVEAGGSLPTGSLAPPPPPLAGADADQDPHDPAPPPPAPEPPRPEPAPAVRRARAATAG